MTDAERLAFLMQPDGMEALAVYEPDVAARAVLVALALAEYPDARLSAAYLLGLLCESLRLTDGSAAAVNEVRLGDVTVKLAAPSVPASVLAADALCARAARLRREVRGVVNWATPLQVLP